MVPMLLPLVIGLPSVSTLVLPKLSSLLLREWEVAGVFLWGVKHGSKKFWCHQQLPASRLVWKHIFQKVVDVSYSDS